jgi:hypothetical protein
MTRGWHSPDRFHFTFQRVTGSRRTAAALLRSSLQKSESARRRRQAFDRLRERTRHSPQP